MKIDGNRVSFGQSFGMDGKIGPTSPLELPQIPRVEKNWSKPGVLVGDEYRAALATHAHMPSAAQMLNLFLGQKLIVVGGGASIAKTLPAIKRHAQARDKSKPVQIAAVNRTHDWLVERGVIPTFAVMMEAREHAKNYITPRKDVIYILNAACHPETFRRFMEAGAAFCVIMALNEKEDAPFILRHFPMSAGFNHAFVTGASTSGMRMVPIGATLGFRSFELHGFDSCAKPLPKSEAGNKMPIAEMYAYKKDEAFKGMLDKTLKAADGRTFRYFNNRDMQQQLHELQAEMVTWRAWKLNLGKGDVTIPLDVRIAGDGVGPWMAFNENAHVDMERMTKKYAGIEHFDYRFA